MAICINNEELTNLRDRVAQNRVYVETIMGIDVYVAEFICNYLAGALDIASAAADCDDDRKVIYINSKLLNGSKKLYDAACRHELGHIFCGHVSADMKDCVIIDNNLELEADAWAVAHGADAKVLRDYLEDVYELQVDIIGKELYNQLVETNETMRMVDAQFNERIAALSK